MKTKAQWKQIAANLNEWAAQDDYKKPRALLVEHTGFFPNHVGSQGPNHNETGLLDFNKRYIEATAIHIAGSKGDYFTRIYVKSTVHSSNAGTYLELRKNGKTYAFPVSDRDEQLHYNFRQCIGSLDEFMPEEYEHFVKYETEMNVVDIATGQGVQLEEKQLKAKFEKNYARGIIDLFQPYAQQDLKERLEKAGIKILVFFRFTHTINNGEVAHHYGCGVKTNYCKTTNRGLEIGWVSSGTYNALPHVLRISKITKMPVVKLYDLGIEKSGYHSHHFKCAIPASQAKEAKRFFSKRFASGGAK